MVFGKMFPMELVPCTEPYWEFVRLLRMDERVAHGFIDKADITPEQQKRYMAEHGLILYRPR